ncbi:Kinesin-like protein kif21a, partial [Dipsacomyces acuminosporus]
DSLGGNSQTLMLACISPSEKNSSESLNTIRYANRARNIRNKVAVNFDKNSSAELSMLKTEVARLRGELSKLKMLRRQSSMALNDAGSDGNTLRFEVEIKRLESANVELSQRLESALHRTAVLEHERNVLRVKIADLGGTLDSIPSTPAVPAASLPGTPGTTAINGTETLTDPDGLFNDGDMLNQSSVLNTMDRELSEQAERHEHQIDSVRRHYASKLELLQETLSIVQKERDVALQRLANSANSQEQSNTDHASKPASLGGAANSNSSRRALGIDSSSASNGTPTKLRLPSRMSKGGLRREFSSSSTPISRKSSVADLANSQIPAPNGRPAPSPAAIQSRRDSTAILVRELQEQLESLKLDSKSSADKANADNERLTQQIQDQAKEISRLRRQRTGRTQKRRYSFLPLKDSSWDVAKSTVHIHGRSHNDAPNLLRAAFIKKILEGELHRCVQARQMLRERDSYLMKQDELIGEQNDLLLCLQGIDSEFDDESSSSATKMRHASERIDIIDAELHYLDLKVRDVEAEVAKLSESTSENSSDPNSSNLLSTPLIINMSGLAMRMVEDVVRIDYRAFSDLFEHLSQTDTTGLAYLFIQDIIELRLLAHQDELTRTELEEQSMDLRRTLLAMQKTALNAALTYERELGDAERKLNALQSPDLSVQSSDCGHHPEPALYDSSSNDDLDRSTNAAAVGLDIQTETLTDSHSTAGANRAMQTPNAKAAMSVHSRQPSADVSPQQAQRSVYESVRERGILLRSAILGASNGYDSGPLPSSSSRRTSYVGADEAKSPVPTVSSPLINSTGVDAGTDSDSSDVLSDGSVIGKSKFVVKDLADDMSDFASDDNDEGMAASYSKDKSLFQAPQNTEQANEDAGSPCTTVDSAFSQEVVKASPPLFQSTRSLRMPGSDEHQDTINGSASDQQAYASNPFEDNYASLPNAPEAHASPSGLTTDARLPESSKSPAHLSVSAQSSSKDTPSTPIESDFSAVGSEGLAFRGEHAEPQSAAGSNHDEFFTEPEDSESDEEVSEIYRSGSGEFFRRPNLARNSSTRSRQRSRHLVRRAQRRSNQGLPPPFVLSKQGISSRPTKKTGIAKRRVDLRSLHISLPIVPPEMIEYINKRNPNALKINNSEPLVASPDLLKQMRIPENGQYENNIAAIASFTVKKPPSVNKSRDVPEPQSPISTDSVMDGYKSHDCIAGAADEPGKDSEHPVELHRAALQPGAVVANDSQYMEMDKKALEHGYDPSLHVKFSISKDSMDPMLPSSVSSDSTPNATESWNRPFRHQLRSSPAFHSNPSPYSMQGPKLSYASVISDGQNDELVFKTTERDIRTSLAVPRSEQASSNSSGVFERQQQHSLSSSSGERSAVDIKSSSGAYSHIASPLSPRSPPTKTFPSVPSSPNPRLPAIAETTKNGTLEQVHRFLSPTERINASLFSMIDAANADPEQLKLLREQHSAAKSILPQAETEHFLTQFGDEYDACARFDPLNQEIESSVEESRNNAEFKPSKIRRRANTASNSTVYVSTVSSAVGSNTSMVSSGGRFTKLLQGFGFGGGSKSREQVPEHSGMSAAMARMNRDRSHSDSTEARKAQMRRAGSASVIGRDFGHGNGASTPLSFASKVHSYDSQVMPISRWRYVRPATATPGSTSSFSMQYRSANPASSKALPATPSSTTISKSPHH